MPNKEEKTPSEVVLEQIEEAKKDDLVIALIDSIVESPNREEITDIIAELVFLLNVIGLIHYGIEEKDESYVAGAAELLNEFANMHKTVYSAMGI